MGGSRTRRSDTEGGLESSAAAASTAPVEAPHKPDDDIPDGVPGWPGRTDCTSWRLRAEGLHRRALSK